MSLFKRPRFPIEIILLCVRWYCKYEAARLVTDQPHSYAAADGQPVSFSMAVLERGEEP